MSWWGGGGGGGWKPSPATLIIVGIVAIFLVPILSTLISSAFSGLSPAVDDVVKVVEPRNEYWQMLKSPWETVFNWSRDVLQSPIAVAALIVIGLLIAVFETYSQLRRGG